MEEVNRVLRDVFGLEKFRANQEKVVEQILKKHDVFVVMPTGAGKSICFQIPALILKGVTIVVSPLISLMNEQVGKLQALNISAIFLNRSLTTGQIKKAMHDTALGLYKIVYVSPERLQSKQFFDFVKKIEVSLVVIDEAHCVLQWGFGFRPSYLEISKFFLKTQTKKPVFAAFTATVNSKSVVEIENLLNLQRPYVLISGFLRPNLFFKVFKIAEHSKLKCLFKMVKKFKSEITIIYCQTRSNVDFLFLVLLKKGFSVEKYHAGLSREARRRSQERFLNEEVKILVATNAFGMGIDKKNVRNVIHYNMPKDLESYYQEAGRAGRDGEISRCFMLYSERDVKINKFIIDKMEYAGTFNESQINEFRQRHYNQLQVMVKYCESSECYVKQILTYFGDTSKIENCYFCGNCQKNFLDLTYIALKILRCVLEFSEMCSCRLILKILKGSFFVEKKFKKCKIYGQLKKSSVKQIRICLTELKRQNYVLENSSNKLILTKVAIDFVRDSCKKFYVKTNLFV